jgi:hypothetical protein
MPDRRTDGLFGQDNPASILLTETALSTEARTMVKAQTKNDDQ